uniref:Uncharacterized protein n=1 Tax=Anguilla anguilla TaxID=7936 RepID=A0A0E9WRX7_ANGAN
MSQGLPTANRKLRCTNAAARPSNCLPMVLLWSGPRCIKVSHFPEVSLSCRELCTNGILSGHVHTVSL